MPVYEEVVIEETFPHSLCYVEQPSDVGL